MQLMKLVLKQYSAVQMYQLKMMLKKVMNPAISTFGALNVVVNNAGASCLLKPIHEYDTDDFKRVTYIDYIGVFLGMKYGEKAMLKSGSKVCSIINISSREGL